MTTSEQTIGAWLAGLAGRTPTPGGGSAAALCAATAAGLTGMVAAYTTGGKWADREERMRQLSFEAAHLRERALAAADDDVAMFGAVTAAYGLPRDTPEQKAVRSQAIQRSLAGAAGPPTEVARLAAHVIDIAGELADSGNPNVASDVAVAAAVARAALESAIVNIDINRQQIRDDAESARLGLVIKELEPALAAADRIATAVREKLQS